MKLTYLDHAAATPLDDDVLAAMQPYFTDQFYNPSATYAAGRSVRAAVDAARSTVAHHLGVRPVTVTFTAGGTEANNVAIHGIMQHFPGKNCVVSAIEHDAVLKPAAQYDCRIAGVSADGTVDLAELDRLIDADTVLVSVMYANNELGTVQPLRQIARLIESKRKERLGAETPLYFHTDACQAANYLDLHVDRLGVDAMTLNGGKIYGPKQAGVLYLAPHVRAFPRILGGGQERGLRSGTENVAGVVGFAAALHKAQGMRQAESSRLQQLQRQCIQLLEQRIPQAQLNGARKHRLPNNVHITIPGTDNERIMMLLDERGIMVAQGSACSASSDLPSHVLKAVGMSDADARASLRITMGRSTTESDIRCVVTVLSEVIADQVTIP